MYAVSSIYWNLSSRFLFYHPRRQVFFSKDNGAFFTVNTVDDGSSMKLFDNLITHERDLSFGLLSSLDILIPALNFRHLAGDRVTAVH